jgi:hypothetical protein
MFRLKSKLFASLALFLFAGCALFSIGYQSAAALNLDNVLFRDVSALAGAKTDAQPQPYNPQLYGAINADIVNCLSIYATIPKSTLSIAQLGYLQDEVNIFKRNDSLSAPAIFFTINAHNLVNTAAQIDSLELLKIKQ